MISKLLFLLSFLGTGLTQDTCPTMANNNSPSQVFQPFLKNFIAGLDPANPQNDLKLISFNRQEAENVIAYRIVFKMTYNNGKEYFVSLLATTPLGQENLENMQIVRFLQSSDINDSQKLLGLYNLNSNTVLPCSDLREVFMAGYRGSDAHSSAAPYTPPAPQLVQVSQSTPALPTFYGSISETQAISAPAPMQNRDALYNLLNESIAKKRTVNLPSPIQPQVRVLDQKSLLQSLQEQMVSGNNAMQPQMNGILQDQSTSASQFQTTGSSSSQDFTATNAEDIGSMIKMAQSGKAPLGVNGMPLTLKFTRKNEYKIGSILSGSGANKIMNPIASWHNS